MKQSNRIVINSGFCLLLAMIIALSSALALMLDHKVKTNVFTIGNVDVELSQPNWKNNTKFIPTSIVPKDPQVKNIGENNTYIFMSVDMPTAIVDNSIKQTVLFDTVTENKVTAAGIDFGVNEDWTQVGSETFIQKNNKKGVLRKTYVYGTEETPSILKTGKTTEPLFSYLYTNDYSSSTSNINPDIDITCYAVQAVSSTEMSASTLWDEIIHEYGEKGIEKEDDEHEAETSEAKARPLPAKIIFNYDKNTESYISEPLPEELGLTVDMLTEVCIIDNHSHHLEIEKIDDEFYVDGIIYQYPISFGGVGVWYVQSTHHYCKVKIEEINSTNRLIFYDCIVDGVTYLHYDDDYDLGQLNKEDEFGTNPSFFATITSSGFVADYAAYFTYNQLLSRYETRSEIDAESFASYLADFETYGTPVSINTGHSLNFNYGPYCTFEGWTIGAVNPYLMAIEEAETDSELEEAEKLKPETIKVTADSDSAVIFEIAVEYKNSSPLFYVQNIGKKVIGTILPENEDDFFVIPEFRPLEYDCGLYFIWDNETESYIGDYDMHIYVDSSDSKESKLASRMDDNFVDCIYSNGNNVFFTIIEDDGRYFIDSSLLNGTDGNYYCEVVPEIADSEEYDTYAYYYYNLKLTNFNPTSTQNIWREYQKPFYITETHSLEFEFDEASNSYLLPIDEEMQLLDTVEEMKLYTFATITGFNCKLQVINDKAYITDVYDNIISEMYLTEDRNIAINYSQQNKLMQGNPPVLVLYVSDYDFELDY